MSNKNILLGVNIDHIATIRQARGTRYPDPIAAAIAAEEAGADGITVHLREDRRHIQERDIRLLSEILQIPMNLEMAVSEEIITIAEKYRPEKCCFVPEKRQELTTEGGLNVVAEQQPIAAACKRLAESGIEVSLFIDPDEKQIDAAVKCGAPVIELHTGCYADASDHKTQQAELQRIIKASDYAQQAGLIVNAGHGLHYHNVKAIAQIPVMNELNIGHGIIARALFVGMRDAVREMRVLMLEAR